MNTERKFEELGIDPINAVKIMSLLDISVSELGIPQRFERFKDILSFLKDFPEDTQRFFIMKATAGKQIDKVSHMFEYVNLLRNKLSYEEGLKNMERQESAIETLNDPFRLGELQREKLEVIRKLQNTKEEIYIYER